MALRRSAVLRLKPDERGPHPHFGGRQWIPPPNTSGVKLLKTRHTPAIITGAAAREPFIQEHDRDRMKYFLEHRHNYLFHTRKVPEFWKNYRFYYKLGEGLNEWRENRVRCRIEELFMNDAVQCTETEAFEVKRVADKLVTLIKDGSKSSRRILQEFFEVKNWNGGRSANTWTGAGEAGDMRALYKALDDFPQRFKNRHGNYTLVTPTHTPWRRRGGPFIDPDMNMLLLRRNGNITIVEMKDRDLSLFHRGQLITGDKGADVWDHDKDRPILDAHRGYSDEPVGVQVDDEVREKEERDRNIRGEDQAGYVCDPVQYLGYQKLTDGPEEPLDLAQTKGWHTRGRKYSEGRLKASEEELEEWPTKLEDIEGYIKNMRLNATQRELYKDENFYKLFPTLGEAAWIEKMYRPYMKMSPERQATVYQYLENTNIHNQSRVPLTDGLPVPKPIEEGGLQDHYRKTWEVKLRYLKSYPYTDSRDKELLGPADRDALDGKFNPDEDQK